jgi:aspartate/methionine/tyrosine aminotransferase
MRERLCARKDTADRLLSRHPGYYRPPCGFFLWMRAGDGVELTRRLWRDSALKVLPGAFLTQAGPSGANDGDDYIRIALVHDLETTREGLARLARALGLAARPEVAAA